ncbi:MAG: hypothetical protein ACR2OR_13800 [Hyphomicrobiales bacterium]
MSDTELASLKGSLEVLEILREEFEQWADEAQNANKKEALENVLRHVESMESEFKRRVKAHT